MSRGAAARYLHVASGTATTSVIEAAGIPGGRSIWADPLYEGPVPAGLSDDELLEVRARHLSGPAGERLADVTNGLRQWRAAIEAVGSYDELTLWYEHDLFDQLNLVQLLAWIAERLDPAPPVRLVCIGSFPGRPGFKGLGELTPVELATLLPGRQPLGSAHYSLATRAWRAFREPAPTGLDDVRRGDSSALPYLAPALTRFLQEFPWTGDGLSRTERRLLQLASDGELDLAAAFPRMHEGEDAYYVTDLSLAALADSLSRTSPPLLAPTAGPDDVMMLRGRRVALTDAGRDVLAGRQDRVSLCGIDRWLGGVHVEGRGGVWRWDAAAERAVRA